jgi:hypothetical protein
MDLWQREPSRDPEQIQIRNNLTALALSEVVSDVSAVTICAKPIGGSLHAFGFTFKSPSRNPSWWAIGVDTDGAVLLLGKHARIGGLLLEGRVDAFSEKHSLAVAARPTEDISVKVVHLLEFLADGAANGDGGVHDGTSIPPHSMASERA